MVQEAISLDVKPGDVILTGRFKNKRRIVKSIGTDRFGQPTINGKSILKFKIEKKMSKKNWSAKSKAELKESKLRKTIRKLILENDYSIENQLEQIKELSHHDVMSALMMAQSLPGFENVDLDFLIQPILEEIAERLVSNIRDALGVDAYQEEIADVNFEFAKRPTKHTPADGMNLSPEQVAMNVRETQERADTAKEMILKLKEIIIDEFDMIGISLAEQPELASFKSMWNGQKIVLASGGELKFEWPAGNSRIIIAEIEMFKNIMSVDFMLQD